MDGREVSRLCRLRLTETLAQAKLSRSALARRIGIDRSNRSQLVSDDTDRLPLADTVAVIATELRIGLDWLLGLSHVKGLGADIRHESLQIAECWQTPVDEIPVRWFEETAGYKVCYMPIMIADIAKTEEVLCHEYRYFRTGGPDRAISASRDKLEHFRLPGRDMEICMFRQSLETLAGRGGIWRTSEALARQLDRLAEVVDELYPGLRMYFFDGLDSIRSHTRSSGGSGPRSLSASSTRRSTRRSISRC